MPTVDCLFENPVDTTHVLKLFNRYHENYVITALNINKEDRVCEGQIKVSDIPELAGKEKQPCFQKRTAMSSGLHRMMGSCFLFFLRQILSR